MTPITFIRIDDEFLQLDIPNTHKMLGGLVKNLNGKGLVMSNEAIGALLQVKPDTVTKIIRSLSKRRLIRIENAQSRHRRIFYSGNKSEVEGGKKDSTPDSNPATPDSNPVYSGNKSGHNRSKRKEPKGGAFHSTFIDYWQSKSNLPKIRAFTDERKRKLKIRMKERLFADNWQIIIDKISASAFCVGNNDRGWKVGVDWVLENSTNYTKVLEGKYDNKELTSPTEPFDAESAKQRKRMMVGAG